MDTRIDLSEIFPVHPLIGPQGRIPPLSEHWRRLRKRCKGDAGADDADGGGSSPPKPKRKAPTLSSTAEANAPMDC